MDYNNLTVACSLLFVAGIIDILGIAAGQSFINGLVWNLAVFLFGLLLIASVTFVQRALNAKLFSLLFVIAGVGAIGAALFCGCNGLLLDFVRGKPLLYYPFAIAQYLALGINAVLSYKFAKPSFSYYSVILGAASLIMFGIWISSFKISYSGTTLPSILVDYSQSLWLIGFATYMMGKDSTKKTTVNTL